ncbi:AMP-binding enzyme, partial [Maribacter sp. 2-571]|uniref:AMP-binding enzyme n=1 Tax=Maribacter sp. 2-571 TaxID=3417569 RepID=UPI003D32EDCD
MPIGKPIANTGLYVVDRSGQVCPIGVIGELWVSGIGVGRGYLNDPLKTAAHFMEDPFQKNGRVYKTGDMARWSADGNLEYMGRNDDQVKIRGHRIELGEIASSLLDQSGIKNCCVLVKEGPDGNKRLIGYIVTDEKPDRHKLERSLEERLPEYMVPRVWVELEGLPLTNNGK